MAKSFTPTEWQKIHTLVSQKGASFGLPTRRDKSVLIGSFNIRKLGGVDKKSAGSWKLFTTIAKKFDLLAVQEVQDNLEGLIAIKKAAGSKYGMAVSDITGSYPGQSPPPERLAFLYNRDVVERTEVASDISYDRSEVIKTLYNQRQDFWVSFEAYHKDLADYEIEKERRKAAGKKAPAKPVPHLPDFVTFIRQPHCVSFRIAGKPSAQPYEFLAVNAHLLYGKYKDERFNPEFDNKTTFSNFWRFSIL